MYPDLLKISMHIEDLLTHCQDLYLNVNALNIEENLRKTETKNDAGARLIAKKLLKEIHVDIKVLSRDVMKLEADLFLPKKSNPLN